MSWENRKGRGRYYTTSRRRGGKVVREYFGTGKMAAWAARADELDRQQREDLKARKAVADALDSAVDVACRAIDLVAQASLILAGYRQHNRGEWRKSRETRSEPNAKAQGSLGTRR
jgi:hypothetical protein